MEGIRYAWTSFELKPGKTHDEVGRWFNARGYRHAIYTRPSPIHTRHLKDIGDKALQALLAEEDCPVVYPPSTAAMAQRFQPSLAHDFESDWF